MIQESLRKMKLKQENLEWDDICIHSNVEKRLLIQKRKSITLLSYPLIYWQRLR